MKRKYDLGCGHLGNGMTVWNRAVTLNGDYKKVAHINSEREITYYMKRVPQEVKEYCESIANGPNPSVSYTQPDNKVFRD